MFRSEKASGVINQAQRLDLRLTPAASAAAKATNIERQPQQLNIRQNEQ